MKTIYISRKSLLECKELLPIRKLSKDYYTTSLVNKKAVNFISISESGKEKILLPEVKNDDTVRQFIIKKYHRDLNEKKNYFNIIGVALSLSI